MLWTSLLEVKSVMDIDPSNTNYDKNLLFYAEQATGLLEEYLGRPGELAKRERTWYYPGTGTQKLLLKHRPVYQSPTPQVFVDESGFFGASSGSFNSQTELTYGDPNNGFVVNWDTEGESGAQSLSRSALLVRTGGYWPRPRVRQWGLLSPFMGRSWGNVKVIYTAGYTLDTLPAIFRLAANQTIARLAYLFPLGMELGSESYEERSISIAADQKDYILGPARQYLSQYRNWSW